MFTFVSYGIPYFEALPGGMTGPLVSQHIPRLLSNPQRYALEEAVPGPTDVSPANPAVTKLRFNVPVQIEANDMLVTMRSDHTSVIDEALSWLVGESETLAGAPAGESGLGGLLTVTSRRLMFNQPGLPRAVAEEQALPYAETVNPDSSMWMGFSDPQVGTSGPPAITTFVGNRAVGLTSATPGAYFARGSIQHLSHVIQDLEQFYERPQETYVRSAAAMFSANPRRAPATRTSSPTAAARPSSPTCSRGQTRRAPKQKRTTPSTGRAIWAT